MFASQLQQWRVLIRGVGDVGSAVAHRLFAGGFTVVLHDSPYPTTSRRTMAFTDAVFDGQAVLAGVTAVRVDDLTTLEGLLAKRAVLPVLVADFDIVLGLVRPHILVDARMRKRAQPEVQRGLASLTIGLGPNFVAGATTDLAVETSWGAKLGAIVEHGPTRPLAGEPRPIAGFSRDRFVYAPVAGIFRTTHRIGDAAHTGEVVASIGSVKLQSPLNGALRGLTHDGVPVAEGTKVIEVDPRGPAAVVRGIGERPGRIATGVMRAVADWVDSRSATS